MNNSASVEVKTPEGRIVFRHEIVRDMIEQERIVKSLASRLSEETAAYSRSFAELATRCIEAQGTYAEALRFDSVDDMVRAYEAYIQWPTALVLACQNALRSSASESRKEYGLDSAPNSLPASG